MFNRDQPLFSRPVLAVIIVATTLAIWLLNLTSPRVDLATPSVETWHTDTQIPVYWLSQDNWEGSDKLSIAIVFDTGASSPLLTAATMALLTGPTLPLSTATINQRLSPVAAAAATRSTLGQQHITMTLSNRPTYLNAALAVLRPWLNDTQFKDTALQHWQRRYQSDLGQQQLRLQLWSTTATASMTSDAMTVASVQQHFTTLKQHVSHIVVAGALTADARQTLQDGLSALTQSMQHTPDDDSRVLATQPATSTLGNQSIKAVYGGLGIQPLTTVDDWLTLQIWAKDSLTAQKSRLNSQTGQWHLHLVPPHAFVRWQISVPQPVLQADNASAPLLSSWIAPDQLPSYQENKTFNALKQQLLQQLTVLSQNPDWWRAIGSRVAMPESPLSLIDFAEHYSEAANSFTIEEYRQRLEQLLIPSSRQEVLIKL